MAGQPALAKEESLKVILISNGMTLTGVQQHAYLGGQGRVQHQIARFTDSQVVENSVRHEVVRGQHL